MMNTRIEMSPTQCVRSTWSTASPLVGSGHDARSSENGLLTIMHGSLEKASQFGWLNAGRTLVDKTYINILWQATELPNIGVTPHHMASELDAFVRSHLQPLWPEFEHLSHEEKHQQAITLVQLCAGNVFGSGYHEQAASWLLYYLCPQLPIFPMSESLCAALTQQQDNGPLFADTDDIYADYHAQCRQQFAHSLPHIHSAAPTASYGSERETDIISQTLRSSDWWQRRCFIHHLDTCH